MTNLRPVHTGLLSILTLLELNVAVGTVSRNIHCNTVVFIGFTGTLLTWSGSSLQILYVQFFYTLLIPKGNHFPFKQSLVYCWTHRSSLTVPPGLIWPHLVQQFCTSSLSQYLSPSQVKHLGNVTLRFIIMQTTASSIVVVRDHTLFFLYFTTNKSFINIITSTSSAPLFDTVFTNPVVNGNIKPLFPNASDFITVLCVTSRLQLHVFNWTIFICT